MPASRVCRSPGMPADTGIVGSEMSEAKPHVFIGEDSLKRFCTSAFIRVGVPPEQADAIAGNLIEADLQGVTSHGVVRLPIYVQRLRAGVVNPRPDVRAAHKTTTTAVIDGDNGMGQWVGMRAMQMAIRKAESGACVFVSVRNSNH